MGRPDHRTAWLIKALEASEDDPSGLGRSLIPYLEHGDPVDLMARYASYLLGASTIRVLAAFILMLSPEEVLAFADLRRSQPSWETVDPPGSTILARLGTDRDLRVGGLLALATSRHGHQRHAAVVQLAALDDPRALPVLLIRCQDWVGMIAQVAIAAVRRLLELPEVRASLPACMGVVAALGGRQRHAAVLRELIDAALIADDAAVLRELLVSQDARRRRDAYKVMLRAYPSSELIARALADPEVRIRADAARLLRAQPSLRTPVVARTLLGDPDPRLRCTAVELVVELRLDLRAALEPLLLDRSAGVRHAARYYLARAGVPALPTYRAALASATTARRLAIAVAAIGEAGELADIGLIHALASHPSTRVAVAALTSMARIDRSAAVATLIAARDSDRPAVARQARLLLRRR